MRKRERDRDNGLPPGDEGRVQQAEPPTSIAPGPLLVDDLVRVIPINVLLLADSPRSMGEDDAHVRVLAEVGANLPPILVNKRTMRVVDGMHRVKAALLRGEATIEARFFNGSEEEAFVVSVQENMAHGLPLSLADRKAAAARIIVQFPHWSDRAIAAMAGLAPSTVSIIRKQSASEPEPLSGRIGRDGRFRPADAAQRRQRASELIAAQPDAPLRKIAEEAHISLGTAHAVRKQLLEAQENPGPPAAPAPVNGSPPHTPVRRPRTQTYRDVAHAERFEWTDVRRQLRSDPTLRYTESGRRLLRWLDARAVSFDELRDVAESVPPHWSKLMYSLAYRFAMEWLDFGELLLRKEDDDVAG